MRHTSRVVFSLLACILLCGQSATFAADKKVPAQKYRELKWEELMPASWQPEKIFAQLDLEQLSDGDDSPEALKVLKIISEEWSKAPADPALQDQSVKLPGYVVSLEWENSATLKEFLLVPYFGACIHVPPPPANQIVYIQLDKPVKGIRTMDAVWVYGTLKLERHDSGSMGSSSYRMRPDKIEPYK